MTCDPDALDPTITVVFEWDGGSAAIGPDCPEGPGMWWQSIGLPQWAYRYTQAPPSAWIPGNVLLAAVPDSAALTLTIGLVGEDQASLEAQKAVLTELLGRWPYTVTVDVGGTPMGVWRADPTMPQWPVPLAQQDVGLFAAEAAVSIPLNPVGSI